MNLLHIFGWRGAQRAYLNLPLAEARARYAAEEGLSEGTPEQTVSFADGFALYSASATQELTAAERAAALAAAEVRADITPIITVCGLHAAFTDFGRAIGGLMVSHGPPKRRFDPEPVRSQFYIVTPGLGEALKARGAPVARYDGLVIWMRSASTPLFEDALLQAIAADYGSAGQRPTPETST